MVEKSSWKDNTSWVVGPLEYWTEQANDASVRELERIADRIGVKAQISQLEGGQARVHIRARCCESMVIVALASDKQLGIVWHERPGAVVLSVCPGASRVVMEGRERLESTVCVSTESEGRMRSCHILPTHSRESQDWAYWILFPRVSKLKEVLPAEFALRRWSLFPVEPVISASFATWSSHFMGSPLDDCSKDILQVSGWVRTLTSPLRTEDHEIFEASHYSDLIGEATKRIRELEETASVSELASRVGVSTRTLQRAFRSSLGVSIKRYLRAQQLRHANEILESGTRSVAYVAHAVGYGHQSRFAREYFDYFGKYPSSVANNRERVHRRSESGEGSDVRLNPPYRARNPSPVSALETKPPAGFPD